MSIQITRDRLCRYTLMKWLLELEVKITIAGTGYVGLLNIAIE
jgi:hypothetical protein